VDAKADDLSGTRTQRVEDGADNDDRIINDEVLDRRGTDRRRLTRHVETRKRLDARRTFHKIDSFHSDNKGVK
jgi:hypothetical protein